MKLVFFETPIFTRLLPTYLDEESYRALQRLLLTSPEAGAVMPGTGGFSEAQMGGSTTRTGQAGRSPDHLLLSYRGSSDLVIYDLRKR